MDEDIIICVFVKCSEYYIFHSFFTFLQLGFKEAHWLCWPEESGSNMLHEQFVANIVLHKPAPKGTCFVGFFLCPFTLLFRLSLADIFQVDLFFFLFLLFIFMSRSFFIYWLFFHRGLTACIFRSYKMILHSSQLCFLIGSRKEALPQNSKCTVVMANI